MPEITDNENLVYLKLYFEKLLKYDILCLSVLKIWIYEFSLFCVDSLRLRTERDTVKYTKNVVYYTVVGNSQ